MTFVGLSSCVCAQEITNNPVRKSEVTDRALFKKLLKPVVVTADPLSGEQADIPRPVTVLQRERMQTRDLRTVSDAVSQELGVSSSDFGPAVGRPVIRGLGGPRVRVLEDGRTRGLNTDGAGFLANLRQQAPAGQAARGPAVP